MAVIAIFFNVALQGFTTHVAVGGGIPTTYTVTFAENDNPTDSVSTYQLGTAPQPLTPFSNLSPSFSDPGHTFEGWNTNPDGSGTSYSDGASYPFNADIELYAQWIPITYTVTFAENDNPTDSVSTYQLGTAPQPLTPFSNLSPSFSDPGHTFEGWNTNPDGSGTSYSDGASYPFNADIELYAQWAITPLETATFMDNGGSGSVPSQTEYQGSTLVIPSGNGLSDLGYTFSGWNLAEDGSGTSYSAGASYVLNSDQTFYAQWTPDTYVVTYNAEGGTGSAASANYVVGSTALTLPTPTQAGYTFDGWYSSSTGGTLEGMGGATYTPTSSVTLYAQWTPNTYVVTYNSEGGTGSAASANYVVGSTALTLPTPTQAGYTLDGWYSSATGGTLEGMGGATYTPTSSVTLYAQWTPDTYVVTYNAEGGTGSAASANYVVGSTSLTLPTPTESGYTFDGWYSSATGGALEGMGGATYTPTSSLTLYAQWTAVPFSVGGGSAPAPVTEIEVSYDANGGSNAAPTASVSVGSTVVLPTATGAQRDGFTLTSWNTAADGSGTSYALGASVTPTSNLTLYAQWSAIPTFAVTFAANGGSGSVSALSGTSGTVVTLPGAGSLLRSGYTLASWNTDASGSGSTFALGQEITVTNNLTLYAQWTATKSEELYGDVGTFASASSALSSDLKEQIHALALDIKAKKLTKVTLYGYTTKLREASQDASLSTARARAVATYLRQQLSELKVTGVSITASGEGAVLPRSIVEVFVL